MQAESHTVAEMQGRSWLTSLPAQMVVFALGIRAVLFALVWLSTRALPPEWTSEASRLLQSWSMWDGGHYVVLAEYGYLSGIGDQDRAAFFPLYPLLMRVGAWLPGVSVQLAGIAISLGSLLVTVWFLTDYVQKRFGPDLARESILILMITPYAVFLTAVYTESLFMMLAIVCLWLADRKSWWAAALFVGLATATRVTGLALVPAVLWLAFRNRESIQKLVGLAALSVSGILAYMIYSWYAMDSPIAFLTAQEDWGGWQHRFGQFLEVFFLRPNELLTGDHVYPIAFINFVLLVVSLVSIPFMWRRLDPGMAMYSTLVISQGAVSIISFGRMMIPAFGVHIVIALWLAGSGWKSTLRQAVVVGSAMVMTLLAVLYAQGKWVI